MALIPPLKTAFCGCSNKTGCKIIGWATLVLGIIGLIVYIFILTWASNSISNTSDEELGEKIIKLLNKTETQNVDIDDEDHEFNLEYVLRKVVGNKLDTNDPAAIGQHVKKQLAVMFNVLIFLYVVIFLIETLTTTTMLYGVYKNKSGYIMFYLVISAIAIVLMFLGLFRSQSLYFLLYMIAIMITHLYLTWVVYSFYIELRDPARSSSPSKNEIRGQHHMEGQVPMLISKGNH
ncbi:uncharacterized protein LOC128986701 [Macrosteles quadrilineatus]|uniref:uncharacterized protein LOC128986701 n=1 Tax=Macrosteles quadrilineatus TaxID=74068 RepID=UPI0023E25070|nr:uncharacterized protein LOC128986701 [Macrosteles quadrilineatus]XP_054263166.1 uncharacterized protein LOC128986701 [Macrosteles quadrilineatus]XP_054263167.1 uncharacterized protein LOC128986701 [Macrosteles quadrilineatus]XP_054263169.1 uncharacterized protein LOC128986701 [Macrosteles quadrilineatus]